MLHMTAAVSYVGIRLDEILLNHDREALQVEESEVITISILASFIERFLYTQDNLRSFKSCTRTQRARRWWNIGRQLFCAARSDLSWRRDRRRVGLRDFGLLQNCRDRIA